MVVKKASKTTSADSNNGERVEGIESSATQKAKVAANRKTPSTQKKITETANTVKHGRRSNPAPASGADNLVVATAAVTTSRRRSLGDATRVAAPASNNAMALGGGTKARRRPQPDRQFQVGFTYRMTELR